MRFYGACSFDEEIYEYVAQNSMHLCGALSGITFPDPRYEIIRRLSPVYSIEYVYSGEGVIQEKDKIYKVSAGDFFILHPNCYHHYYANPKNPWKKIFLTLNDGNSFPTTLLKLYKIENITVFHTLNTPLNLEKIFRRLRSGDAVKASELETYVFELFAELAYHSNAAAKVSSTAEIAKNYIDKCLNTQITISKLSEYVGLSPSYLCRVFKNNYGLSPSAYIQNEKIDHAKVLLAQTSMSIKEISESFSFSDVSHFSHIFTKSVGMSPSKYREKHRL